ncbi:MAG: hypothetical protein HY059_22830 [Proteobacteria bacterium]|nr:hypothetical protein [Pseudomonadota bacterium]
MNAPLAAAAVALAAAVASAPGTVEYRVLAESDGILSFAWTVEDAPRWLQRDDGADSEVRRHREWAAAKADVDPVALIKRQREVYARAGLSTRVFDWMLPAADRFLRPMNRIEGALFSAHHKRHGAAVKEFGAHILRKGDRIRVYYTESTALNEAFSLHAKRDKMTFPHWDLVEGLAAKDVREDGWTLYAHVHRHPFSFDNPYGDVSGTTIPSAADVDTYVGLAASLRLERAWITNGISSMDVPSSEFSRIPKE